jgi:DNA-binding transcriptional MocR family regulator
MIVDQTVGRLCLRAVTRPGDAVAVESPTYYGALQTLETLGLRAIEVATDPRTGIRLDHLRRVVARHRVAACFVMPCFSNPTGIEMADAANAELVDLLERAGIPPSRTT